jgi:hypothetical protein
MAPTPDLTVEILEQIRDGVLETKAEVTTFRHQLEYVHAEQVKTNQRLDRAIERIDGAIERIDGVIEGIDGTNERLDGLERTMARVARTNDATLSVALEDAGREMRATDQKRIFMRKNLF